MKPKTNLRKLVILLITLMSAISANAAEAYACYTSSNTTLTFYYDNNRSSRPGTKYSLNTGSNKPDWNTDGSYGNVTKVVFDPSFTGVCPTSTFYWFYGMSNLQSVEGLIYLNTSEVTDMTGMFGRCKKLTSLDLSSFNTSKVTDMRWMFYDCTNLKTIYIVDRIWSTFAVAYSSNMFKDCTSLVGGQDTRYDASHVDKNYARIDHGTSYPGYFTAGNEAYACYNRENTTLTFYYDNLRSIRNKAYFLNTGTVEPDWCTNDIKSNVTKVVFHSSFANARPTTTYGWFYSMPYIESITGLNYLNTSEVTNMAWMFGYCYELTTLDLSNFNTSKVTTMEGMFYECLKLQTIYVGSGWNTNTVSASSDMFYNCIKLVGGQGTTYNDNHTKAYYAHIDGGTNNPGYFTARNLGIATGLNQVTSDKSQVQSNEWYTIDGRKLNGMPAKKGIYIQNRKAVLKK